MFHLSPLPFDVHPGILYGLFTSYLVKVVFFYRNRELLRPPKSENLDLGNSISVKYFFFVVLARNFF